LLLVDEMDEQKCQDSLDQELAKPAGDQDKPRLRKLFRATFTLRRNIVVAAKDCEVAALLLKCPLLGDAEFVSICQGFLLFCDY